MQSKVILRELKTRLSSWSQNGAILSKRFLSGLGFP